MKGKSQAKTPERYIEELQEPRKSEIAALDRLIRELAPKLEPHMRNGMIGYGVYQYEYESGRKGEWFAMGLASNKNYISLYCCAVVDGQMLAETYKPRFPKANIGRSCIRFKRLDDVDLEAVKSLIMETSAAF